MSSYGSESEDEDETLFGFIHPPFSPELIDRIIDELAMEDDTQSLINCSLASSHFVESAQRHIFKKITLGCTPRGSSTKLNRLLTHSPHLASYMTFLRLEEGLEPRQALRRWLGSNATLRTIIPKLTCLKELQVNPLNYKIKWSKMGDIARWALESLLSKETLLKVEIRHISGLPLEVLPPSIRVLDLLDVDILPLGSTGIDPSRPPSQLTELRVMTMEWNASVPLLAEIAESPYAQLLLNIYGLRKFVCLPTFLTLSDALEGCERVGAICLYSSQTLTEIWFDPMMESLWNKDVNDITTADFAEYFFQIGFPNLHTLHLYLEIHNDDKYTSDNYLLRSKSLKWTAHVLTTIRQDRLPSLDTLKIKCVSRQDDTLAGFDEDYWTVLDAVLAEPNLTFISKVEISLTDLRAWNRNPFRAPGRWARLIKRSMVNCGGRPGRLTVLESEELNDPWCRDPMLNFRMLSRDF